MFELKKWIMTSIRNIKICDLSGSVDKIYWWIYDLCESHDKF